MLETYFGTYLVYGLCMLWHIIEAYIWYMIYGLSCMLWHILEAYFGTRLVYGLRPHVLVMLGICFERCSWRYWHMFFMRWCIIISDSYMLIINHRLIRSDSVDDRLSLHLYFRA
jgi:hypothetical protein